MLQHCPCHKVAISASMSASMSARQGHFFMSQLCSSNIDTNTHTHTHTHTHTQKHTHSIKTCLPEVGADDVQHVLHTKSLPEMLLVLLDDGGQILNVTCSNRATRSHVTPTQHWPLWSCITQTHLLNTNLSAITPKINLTSVVQNHAWQNVSSFPTYADVEFTLAPDAEIKEDVLIDMVQQLLVTGGSHLCHTLDGCMNAVIQAGLRHL